MKMRILFLFSTLMFAVSMSAAPVACTPSGNPAVTLAVVGGAATGATITCGNIVFSNFVATDFGNAAGDSFTYSLGTLGSSTGTWYDSTTGVVNVAFNPNFSNGQSPQDIHLTFNVSASGGWMLTGVDGTIGGTGAHYTETVCNGLGNAGSPCLNGATQLAQFTVFSSNLGGPTSYGPVSFAGGATASSISVFKDIGAITISNQTAELTSMSQSFEFTTPASVPEPATFVMLSSGLLSFAFGRRRKKLDRQADLPFA